MPVYKPPLRGAPVGRVGGATRGAVNDMPVLAALVPEHTGLTVQEQPCFYWYLSKSADYAVEFTLIDEKSFDPLLEKKIEPPVQSGINCIRLTDFNIHLSTGKIYKWFVALVLDPDHRSKDIIAGGAIERVNLSHALRDKLQRSSVEEHPNIYAESGLWYNALTSICTMIEKSPGNVALKMKRRSLLEQVGLNQIR